MSTIATEYGLGSSARDFPDSPCDYPSEEVQFSPHDDVDVLDWDSWEAAVTNPPVEDAILLEKSGITAPNQQREFWRRQTICKNTVAAKLRQAGLSVLAAKLEHCHSEYTVATCKNCDAIRKFPNRCDLFCCPECANHLQFRRRQQVEWWTKLEHCHSEYTIATCKNCDAVRKFPNRCDLFCCPECANHLQFRRRQQVEWWTKLVTQPKHVVLTIRNIRDLSAGHVRQMKKYLEALRRRKFCRNWRGGFYRIEVTLGKGGWHLHIHLLVDADWIDQPELKQQWNSVTGGGGYIVKVKDCRESEYLREVTKYVVKSTTMAQWSPDTLRTFVLAFTGLRLFGVFGSLYGARTKFADFIAELKDTRRACDCDDPQVVYQSEEEFSRSKQPRVPIFSARPPPPAEVQIPLIAEHHQCRD